MLGMEWQQRRRRSSTTQLVGRAVVLVSIGGWPSLRRYFYCIISWQCRGRCWPLKLQWAGVIADINKDSSKRELRSYPVPLTSVTQVCHGALLSLVYLRSCHMLLTHIMNIFQKSAMKESLIRTKWITGASGLAHKLSICMQAGVYIEQRWLCLTTH